MDTKENWLKRFSNIIESLTKKDFALLPKSKDLEKTFLQLLKEAPPEIPTDLQTQLRLLSQSLDALSMDEKKLRLLKIKDLLLQKNFNEPLKLDGPEDIPSLETYRKNRKILSQGIETLKGIGPKLAQKLAKRDLHTIEDLLFFLPRTYEDRRKITPIGNLVEGVKAVVFGEILKSGINYYSRRKTYEILITDGTGFLTLKWFHFQDKVMRGLFPVGKKIYAIGEVNRFLRNLEMSHPETISEEDTEKIAAELGHIVPIYPTLERIPEKTLRKILQRVVKEYVEYVDNLIPTKFLQRVKLLPLKKALIALHLPQNSEKIEILLDGNNLYHRSLSFEEFFFLELGLALKKSKIALEKGIAFNVESRLAKDFLEKLPFELTSAQKKVIEEIKRDMARDIPMNRLIQGDVGCGKTVVAFVAGLIAIENGYQVALMAPTEILAEQHYRSFRSYAQLMGVESALLTGGLAPSRKREICNGLATGFYKFVIGTHALFQEGVEFKRLGLVIIDEQHRFGVLQRASLREKAKGLNPDTLVMTATPIPRTLALTVYGDLDVSIIDEMPKGRKPVITKLFLEYNRRLAYEEVRKELQKGHQAYVILPLIEESEALDLKAVLTHGKELQEDIFPEFKVGILHGKMSSQEKDMVMQAFKRREIDVLVSTTVVEVGVDVPNATVIVIEHAERFGLSQLHQLRGRVGRSDKQSYCFLIAYKISFQSEAYKRLQVLCKTNDGFKIAEADMHLRGPGDIFGTQQSGFIEFKRADPVRDIDLLLLAKEAAFELIKEDPTLERYPALREELFRRWEERLKLSEIA
ncbi:ATP-dependent DNA helicase RecG [Caldimicrobium thiodismutans]|uniref:ATP-dependent DNA helicase RecG n=1 Tax=Caldimicrobium thiodismutans TaxID=1653476 RepID=A0A0U4W0M6_9BACT|nr:ATP-dependent DNA helicase RecG [Caldimicrobium thiodismutans]BAU22730.1 ATP-dependent DNA helicase RecG [Caldimicrobium thiodismutans]